MRQIAKFCGEDLFPQTFVYIREKYITFIYTIRAISRKKLYLYHQKHSKCKMAMCFGCKRQHVQTNEHTLDILISVELLLVEILSRENVVLETSLGLPVHKFSSCGHGEAFFIRALVLV